VRPEPKNLVIYELLVRDFVATHDYKTIKDTLNYFVRLGVNAIELMPFNEFEGNNSWGYNPNFYFAPDKYYGTKNDLKALIDACHGKGIAVIQDIVLNHSFSSSPMVQLYYSGTPSTGAPTADNPWYNVAARHPFNVGFQFNHESQATKYFVKNVLSWWMKEYHIDGYRFDLAKGFTQVDYGTSDAAVGPWGQYDASRVAIWKDYNNTMKAIDPKFYVILEDFASNDEENELANEGMMTWNNLSGQAEQATMGYNDSGGSWDISALFYNTFSFTNPYALVSYFESHDQERLQFKNGMYGNASGTYSIKNLPTGLKRDEMGAAFMFSSPGPKMVWQFGERGYDISIDNGGRLGIKEPHWEYMADPDRRALFALYAKMIKLKIKNPVFTTTNYQYNLGGVSPIKNIQLNGADGTNVEVVGNFGVIPQTGDIPFAAIGTWTDALTGATINVTTLPFSMTLAPGEYHVYSNRALLQ
jgi:1,4-alpha-glucan branching enzyme